MSDADALAAPSEADEQSLLNGEPAAPTADAKVSQMLLPSVDICGRLWMLQLWD